MGLHRGFIERVQKHAPPKGLVTGFRWRADYAVFDRDLGSRPTETSFGARVMSEVVAGEVRTDLWPDRAGRR